MILLAAFLLATSVQEAPKSYPVRDGLRYLLHHQEADGSWGGTPATCSCKREPDPRKEGDLETTAWAILAFAGAGYTELSQDDIDGRKVGPAVKAGIEWLISKQDKEGAFDRDDASINSIVALSLFETYGMTVRHEEVAQKAFHWIRDLNPNNTRAQVRLGMAWESARFGDLVKDSKEQLRKLASTLESGKEDNARIGGLLIRAFVNFPRGANPAKVDYGAFDVTQLGAEDCNVLTCAWRQMDGGNQWHKWYDRLRKHLGSLQRKGEKLCESGSWDGPTLRERLRTTAIRCLTMEHYRCFFCRSAFRK